MAICRKFWTTFFKFFEKFLSLKILTSEIEQLFLICMDTEKFFDQKTKLFPRCHKTIYEEASVLSITTKEIVMRRHGEPIKFLFLPKMGLLGSQAGNEKKCCLWIMSNFWGLFFHVFMGKNYFSIFFWIELTFCSWKHEKTALKTCS